MNRKTLITLLFCAIVLTAGIVLAVSKLYSGNGTAVNETESGHFLERHPLVKAIPSDAAMVLCFKDFKDAAAFMGDSVSIFRRLVSDKFRFISEASFPSLRKCSATMSVHYSKDLPPLLVIGCPEGAVTGPKDTLSAADTSADVRRLLSMAAERGLSTRIDMNTIMISTSGTLINSSARHLAEGHSILEATGFSQVAAQVRNEDAIFVNNAYIPNLMEAFAGKKHFKHSAFIKDAASWTVLGLEQHSAKGVILRGNILYEEDPSNYINILDITSGESKVAESVPSHTAYLAALPVKDIKEYLKSWRSYLDAKVRLDEYQAEMNSQSGMRGMTAEAWAKSIDLKEVAIAGLNISDGCEQFLLIRSGSRKGTADSTWNQPGFAKSLFGGIFTATDEKACLRRGEWTIVGSLKGVAEYSEKLNAEGSLKECLTDNGLTERLPGKECGFWLYHSLTEDPSLMDSNFSPVMRDGFKDVITGAPFVPVTLTMVRRNERMAMDMTLDRTSITKSKVPPPTVDRDTTVTVPEGPFKVTNSATGKDNLLYQNSHLSICLQDENGKDLWGIPFKKKFCGFVQDVDYYNNGKIQFAFAAGSELYLIDRLGRFVGGFPVDLGKEIVLGPMVYDFTGAKGYTAVLVYKDNTVGYIDLHGKRVEGWSGIAPDETIKFIPELYQEGNEKYWIIRTSRQAMLYPFLGGEPVLKGEGSKTIMPDSPFETDDKGGVKARCYDGKDRSFKFEKQ